MALFLASYENKLDKKGRVSVPAAFRNQLVNESFSGIVTYPAPALNTIEACGYSRAEQVQRNIGQLNPFSNEFNTLVTWLASEARPLQFDAEGRIVLTDRLINYAGIKEKVLFAGRGETFQIWDPDRYEENRQQAMQDIAATSGLYQQLMQPQALPQAVPTPPLSGQSINPLPGVPPLPRGEG